VSEDIWLRTEGTSAAYRSLDPPKGRSIGGDTVNIVVLIHGYQTGPEKAGERYRDFRDATRRVNGGGIEAFGAIQHVYWQGEHPFLPVSVLGFPIRTNVAHGAGSVLATDWFKQWSPKQRVHIVAHSLGCRVALDAAREVEVLRRRGEYDGAQIAGLYLLAAAVPMDLCANAEILPRPHDHDQHVVHSAQDRVLLTFGMGSWFTNERGMAVGRFGDPIPGRWATSLPTDLGHGDYWNSPLVAEHVCMLLGLIPWRNLQRRYLAASSAGGARELYELELSARRLAARWF
jgi:pimeloyl-ACP methyl ester carboxylesterase